MTRLPLDTATNAGSLVTVDRLAGEHGLDGGAEITTGDQLVVAGTTVVQLSTVHQSPVTIEEIEVRSAGRVIGFRDFLRVVVTEWKGKAKAQGHFFELGRCIIGIPDRVVTADRDNA